MRVDLLRKSQTFYSSDIFQEGTTFSSDRVCKLLRRADMHCIRVK
jgi:hypothetical protein